MRVIIRSLFYRASNNRAKGNKDAGTIALFDRALAALAIRVFEELNDRMTLAIIYDARLTSNNRRTSIDIAGKAKGETVPS